MAYQLDFNYDPTILQPETVFTSESGTLSNGMTVTVNNSTVGQKSHRRFRHDNYERARNIDKFAFQCHRESGTSFAFELDEFLLQSKEIRIRPVRTDRLRF